MDQTVCMDHFNGCRKGSRVFPVSAAHTAEIQGKNRPQPLAACQEAVLHGLENRLLGLIVKLGINIFKIGFHEFPVLPALILKVHPENPPPLGCRPGQS